MNINGISGSIYPVSPIPSGYHPATGSMGDGSSAIGGNSNSGQVGSFVSAIFQALSQSGISGTSSATSTSASGSNPLQALGSFMQTLISVLQDQSSPSGQAAAKPAATSSAAAATAITTASSSAAPTTSAPLSNVSPSLALVSGHYRHGRHGGHGGGPSQIESNLQSLIQQLSSGATATSTSSARPSSATGACTSTSALGSLQQSFQVLTSSLGNPSSSASAGLGNFLQAFSQNLERLGSTGNIVNTQA